MMIIQTDICFFFVEYLFFRLSQFTFLIFFSLKLEAKTKKEKFEYSKYDFGNIKEAEEEEEVSNEYFYSIKKTSSKLMQYIHINARLNLFSICLWHLSN